MQCLLLQHTQTLIPAAVALLSIAAFVLPAAIPLLGLLVTAEAARHPVVSETLFTTLATSAVATRAVGVSSIARGLLASILRLLLATVAGALLLATVIGLLLATVTRLFLTTISALALLAVPALLAVASSVESLAIASRVALGRRALALLAPVFLLTRA